MSTSPIGVNPASPQIAPVRPTPPVSVANPALNPQPASTPPSLDQLPDQFQPSTSPTGDTQKPEALKPAASPALRFGGGDHHHEGPGFLKKTAAGTLGIMSGIGLAVGVPLGLLQMAVGIIIHPLLITGMLTMALPALGLLGAYFLGKGKH